MPLSQPSGEESLVGAVLSRRYLLKHEIGRGGMGAVYAAQPTGGGPAVAIKILHSHFLGDELVLTRFLEEGRTCMRLIHPNILKVHECLAAEDGSPYLVMDLLEGVPLSAYTKNGGRVGLAHAIPILQGMLAGLDAAHAQGVVHRDLKPGNVFLARAEGGVFSVRLLDFGIAKVMDAAGGMGNKTRTGALLGTPAYMSPEQVKSAKDVDARADLWSVGVMFYEMLTGRVAFPAPTEYARLAAVLSATPEPVTSIDPELRVVVPFLDRALQKDRALRFQTAAEMSEELDAYMPEPPTTHAGKVRSRPSFAGDTSCQAFVSPLHALDEPSPWSMATSRTDPPSEVIALAKQLGGTQASGTPGLVVIAGQSSPQPPAAATPEPGALLMATMQATPHSSTLASPNGGGSQRPSHSPPPVVLVAEEELVVARERAESIPGLPSRGAPWGLVVLLMMLALGAGVGLGYFLALRY